MLERIVVVTTSYPERPGDAQGHFVASEVRLLGETADVTVLAPGCERRPLGSERVISLGGADAFGFPGALARIRDKPWRSLEAAAFVTRALRWLAASAPPTRLVAHFLLPCGVPIATRGVRARGTAREIVVHGSDARLFAALPLGQRWLGDELLRSQARLRFVSSELERLVLGRLSAAQRRALAPRCHVEPCAIDVPAALGRTSARRLLGIDARARLAVVVARLVRSKRVEVALEACSRVRGLDCVVIGDGPERPSLTRRYPATRFVGQLERPLALAYLAAADALVSASLQEGAPTVIREARALGTTVVCLKAGDVARWAETDAGIHVVG